MAFKIEEIQTLIPALGENPIYNSNYIIIVDYLTGKTNVLGTPVQDWSNSFFGELTSLVKNIKSPTQNDELIFEVMCDANILQRTNTEFFYAICKIAIADNTKESLDALLKLFLKANSNEAEMFEYLLYEICISNNKTNKIDDIVLTLEFLVSYIKKKNKLIIPSRYAANLWQREWNTLYFILLEEANVPALIQYIDVGLTIDSSNMFAFLLKYKNGFYMAEVAKLIEQEPTNFSEFALKLKSIVQLLETDEYQYKQQAIKFAKAFLDFYKKQSFYSNWENGMHLKEFNKTNLVIYLTAQLLFIFCLNMKKKIRSNI